MGGVNEKFIAPSSKTYSFENKDKLVDAGLKYVFLLVIIADDVGNPVVTLKLPVPEMTAICEPVTG